MSSVNPFDEQYPGKGAATDGSAASMRGRVLVEAREVVEDLSGGRGAVIVDVRAGQAGLEAFERSHFPGAFRADLETDLAAPGRPGAPERGGRHPLPERDVFVRTIAGWGITSADQPVFLYDAAGGAMAAARLWWMLGSIGHRATRIVDGGWQELVLELERAGLSPDRGAFSTKTDSIQTEKSEIESPASDWPASDWPASDWLWPVVEAEQVAAAKRRGLRVLDVRSPVRFRGEQDPFDPNPGRIPGACNLDFTRNLGSDGRFLPDSELLGMFEESLAGVPPDRWIVHCGSGVTACHTLAAMAAVGLEGAALYVGSYSEWCRSGREIDKG